MNRAELITAIAEMTDTPKVQVSHTLSAMIHTITGAVAKGDRVTLVGFGTFERRKRQSRTGRNPRTMAVMRIPAAQVPAFRPGQELKEIVNGQRRLGAPALSSSKSAPARKTAKKSKKR